MVPVPILMSFCCQLWARAPRSPCVPARPTDARASIAENVPCCETLRPSAAGSPIAEHRENSWIVQDNPYLRLDCKGRLMLQLADPQGTLGQVWGPFEHLSSSDGVSGLQCPTLVARIVVP